MSLRKAIIAFLSLLPLLAGGAPASAQSIDLLSPDTSGLVWSGANDVSWLASFSGWTDGDTVRLDWTTNGTSYTQFAQNLPYDLRTFRWFTSTLRNDNYYIKVTKSDAPLIFDESVDFFHLSNPVLGKTYFVNDTDLANDVYCTAVGDNANSGLSPAAPKWNLQSIIDGYALGAGDVVFVDTGNWSLPDRIYVTSSDRGTSTAHLAFAGSPNGTIFSGINLPGSRSCLHFDGSLYWELAYFSAQSSPVSGIRIQSNIGCALYAATATGNLGSGISVDSSSRIRMEYCSAQGNDIGINIFSPTSNQIFISQCRLINNREGVNISQSKYVGVYGSSIKSTSGNIVLLDGPSRLLFCGNTLEDVTGIYLGTGTSSVRIYNNIIQPSGSEKSALNFADVDSDKKDLISDFNLINPILGAIAGRWKRDDSYPDLRTFILGTGQDGHSIGGDPLFFDPAGDDFHLQSTEGRYSDGSWHEDSEDSPALNGGAVSFASALLTAGVQPRASIFPLSSSSGFTAGQEWIEVEADFANYTGIAGNNLIGCAGSAFAHSTGALVVQPAGADFSQEPDPNGERANIGAYSNTPEASKSSRRSLFVDLPLGKPLALEKWSAVHDISWRTFGDGWTGADTLSISCSTDSVNWTLLTAGIAYDSSPYAWYTASGADSSTTRVRIEHSAGTTPRANEARSGIMVVDNSPPANVGCSSPADGVIGLPRLTTLVARELSDSPAGLNASPYYFRVDTDPGFASPNLLSSDWIANNLWTVSLFPNTTYYWQVRGRDNADPPNESPFQAQTDVPGSYRTFRTQGIYRAETVEPNEAAAVTNGLRWILQNYNLDQGDIVYVAPGAYTVSEPIVFSPGDEGTETSPVRVTGWGGEVLLDGNGTAGNCLQVTGDWFQIENFSFTGAVSSGVRISGKHVTLQGGRSFRNGGDGIEVGPSPSNTGDYAEIRNMLAYENSLAGIHLLSSFSSVLENNTCAGNGTREIYLEDLGMNGSADATLRNNIAWARGTGGQIAVFVEPESQTGFDSDYNDIFASAPAQVGYWNSATQTTFANWTGVSGGDPNSISATPLFVGGGNYRLQSTAPAGSYKPGIGWTGDGADSPCLDHGDPRLPFGLETAPNGGRVNLGAYGNTQEASRSPGKTGRNFYVNESSVEYDYFCSTAGLPWPAHNGLSPASPLDSVQAVLDNYTLAAGDSIFIDTGFYSLNSPITVSASGSAGNPVTLTGSPEGTIFDARSSATNCLSASSAPYVSLNGLQFINARQSGISAYNSDYLMISGCRIATAGLHGISIAASQQILIRDNQLVFNKSAGIYCNECSDNSELCDNTAQENQSHGIFIYQGSSIRISRNTSLLNSGHGIYLYAVGGSNTVEGNASNSNSGYGISCLQSPTAVLDNSIRGNGSSSIRLSTISNQTISGNICSSTGISADRLNNCQFANNLILDTTGTGIYLDGGTNLAFQNNTFYRTTSRAVYIPSNASNARFSNNIFWAEGTGNAGLYFQYPSPADHGHTLDYNLYHALSGATIGYWGASRSTFSAWQLATRQDSHGFSADPLFGNPAGGDFHLRSTEGKYLDGKWEMVAGYSPGLNKGEPASDYSQELSPNGGRINLGAYGNTPEASRSGMKTLSISTPLGSPWGTEKWSRNHEIIWAFRGSGWLPSDTIRLEYTTNGVSFFEITAGLPYISGIYSSWNTLSASGDNTNYRVKISSPTGPAFFTEDISGFCIVDNTPPTNVGCRLPADGSLREPLSTTLTALSAGDSPAGLNANPYYFQIDTTPFFNSPNRQNSGWRALPTWHAALQPNTTYYWRVNARDDADPVNERGFCGDANAVGTCWSFRTLGVYHALDIESETVGLRWIADNVALNPGDIVYVDAGTYTLSEPLELGESDQGSGDATVRIVGYGGEVILDAGGVHNNCLVLSGDYFLIENFVFTNALSSGVLITGDHNTLTGGASYLNGGDGIQATGSYITVKNMRVYDNALAGIHLYTSQHSLIESNTCARNGTREVFLEDQVPAAPYHRVGSADCSILNNILWASGAGRIALWVDSESQVEFSSDYNDLYSSSGGAIGYWNSATQAAFADWKGASFQDQSSINRNPLFAPGPDDFHLLSTGGRWDGGSWTTDTQTSPGVDQGSPFSIYALESAPNGGRINLGAYGNTVQASRAPSLSGRNFYVNDADTEWDYYCSTGGLPWPDHDGMSPASPLSSLRAVFTNHTMLPGDTVYVDTGLYSTTSTISVPAAGTAGQPITIAGSPYTSILDIEGVLSTCLSIADKSYISLDRIWIFNASGNALSIASSPSCAVSNSIIRGSGANAVNANGSYLILKGNVLSYNFGSGVYLWGGRGALLEDNIASHNSSDGFSLINLISATLRGNTAFANLGRGAYLYNLSGNNLVSDNRIESNQGTGLYAGLVQGGFFQNNTALGNARGMSINACNRGVITGNTVYSNAGPGLYVSGSSRPTVAHNTAYGNTSSGIFLENECPNSMVINNTCYQNGGELKVSSPSKGNIIANNVLWATQTGAYAIYVDSLGQPSSNYNILYATGGADIGYWLGKRTTFDQWKTASGQDGASLNFNPMFVDPGNGDFHLQSPLGSYHDGLWTPDFSASPGLNLGQIYTADSYLAQPISPSSTFLELTDASNFLDQTDTADIQGDFTSYTGKAGNLLVGASDVDATFPAGTRVFQPAGSDYTLEPEPNGGRINIGSYGGTSQASLADLKTLAMVEPVGGEKWNGIHDIRWLAVGEAWVPGDILIVEYTTNGTSFFTIATETYPSQLYANWSTLSAAGDGSNYQISVREPDGLRAGSGTFTIDNTSPFSVGCFLPENADTGLPAYVPLRALNAGDALVGLHPLPYYFQVATSPAFASPGLINSGWVPWSMWTPSLSSGTTYYWRVKARDEIFNESVFCGFSADTGGYGVFSTSAVHQALNIESATTGLRWILANRDLEPGDTIYVSPGTYVLASPLAVSAPDSGSSYSPVRIAGTGAGVILDGSNLIGNCLVLDGDFIEIDNISFTRATGAGLLVPGDNNTVRRGRSWGNGGDGCLITGNANTLLNFVLDANAGAGTTLDGGEGNRVVNATSYNNGLGEIICQSAPHSYLRNNILWAAATSAYGIYVDGASQNGFVSDYNDLLGPAPAFLGYWGGDITDLASWRAASLQDGSSLSLDPLFAPVAGDYHLQSPAGRWVAWATWTDSDDNLTWPCIDAGDPSFSCAYESSPKGGRINLGAYGNTYQASRSPGAPGTNYWVNDTSLVGDVYTSATGSDSYSGALPNRPKRTLNNLIDLANLEPGDTVFIDTGIYPLAATVEIGLPDSGGAAAAVSLVGSPNRSLLPGNAAINTGLYLNRAQYLDLESLTLADNLDYGVRSENASHILLGNSAIEWNGQSGAGAATGGGAGIRGLGGSYFTIADSVVSGNIASGIQFDNCAGLALSGNRIEKNYGYQGIGTNYAGVQVTGCPGLSVNGNTVFLNFAGLVISDSNAASVDGNAIYSNMRSGATFSNSSAVFRNNLVYANLLSGAGFSGQPAAVRNNTFYGNIVRELTIDAPNCTVQNNTAWATGTGYGFYFLNTSGHFSDFNNIYTNAGGGVGWWGGAHFTLGEWQIASRRDSHSLSADPLFANPSGADGILGGRNGADDDFHPESTEGSYHFGSWTADAAESPSLNSGSPYDDYGLETEPNGRRINQGAYGGTAEASRSSLDSLFLINPYGGAAGNEKWSGEHDLAWLPVGEGWGGGDTVNLSYSIDGSAWSSIAAGIAWDALTFPSWDTSASPDGATYQVRVADDSDPGVSSSSGRFIIDNSPPVNVGCISPANGSVGHDVSLTLTAASAIDALAGLHSSPYYFRLDTSPSFSSSSSINSGWLAQAAWPVSGLDNRTWYYWQVQARDTADLPNVSAFFGDTDAPGSWWTFRTAAVFIVNNPEEFRDVLDSYTLEQGDRIYVNTAGAWDGLTAPIVVTDVHSGTAAMPIVIQDYNGRPVISGDGAVSSLLDVQGSYFLVQGIDFTGAGGSGLLLEGDHNTANSCSAYENGVAGFETTGFSNRIQNTFTWLNTQYGILLNGAATSWVLNNSAYGNGSYGIYLSSSTATLLNNNSLWSAGTGQTCLGADGTSQPTTSTNWDNLYASEGAAVGDWGGIRPTLADWQAASFQDLNSLSRNPRFYKIAWWGNREFIYDLHLVSNMYGFSPNINRGWSGGTVPLLDYDQEGRWDDPLVPDAGGGPFAYYDIGADEYVDQDMDYLPDYWENVYFGHLGEGYQFDTDEDGLINIDEYYYYTNPANPDTDFDAFSDGEEVDYGTNALDPDTDYDGLLDGWEIYYYTNSPYSTLTSDPLDPDTDDDGYNANFNDGSEVAYWNSHSWARWDDDINYGGGNGLVNLLDPDSDGDGCPDGWEVFYGLDPADYGQFEISNGGVGDPDGDRLNNVEEYYFGTSPVDPASPITRYIDRLATGAGNGTSWPNAFTSLENGLDWANGTSVPVILLATSGVYYERNLELERDRIALFGTHPRMPILDGQSLGRGFIIFNVGIAKIDSFVIRNCRVSGPGAGIYLSNSSPTLSNLVLYRNVSAGTGRGGAMNLAVNSSPLIADCAIVGNTGYNNYGGIYVASGIPLIYNTILWGNGDDLQGVAWNQLFACDIEDGDGAGFNGNISLEPNFYHRYSAPLDPQKYLHVNAASPAINAGHSWRTMIRDFEGDPRWNYLSVPAIGLGIPGRNYYDIGTDEFVDLDYNTLPDWWEMSYFGATGQNPALDQEPDGLINSQEYYYLTDPLNADTDFDRLTDSDEVSYWNTIHDTVWPDNPNNPHRWDSDDDGDYLVNVIDGDSDTDALIDGLEVYYYLTDPGAFDTDADGLGGDGEEVDYWNIQHNLLFPSGAHTTWNYDWDGDGIVNLLDWDSDNDGMPDGWENDYLLDPCDDGFYFLVNGAGGDPDDDRVNNWMEYRFDTDPTESWSPQTVVVAQSGWADYTSIGAAIAAYSPQSYPPRVILVRPGTYAEKNLVMKEGLSLLGEYAAATILDASGGRGLIFNGVVNALVDGFTIRNASVEGPGAGILCYASSPFISNCIIAFNTATGPAGFGGAIYCSNFAYPDIVNCTIADNRGTDDQGGVYLAAPEDQVALANTILWSNGDELFGTQTGMVRYCDIEDGDYAGVNGNLSADPVFTNQSAGNYHIHWTSPLLCIGDYPKAGGYDLDGTSRPQTVCPGPLNPIILPPQQAFEIGVHEPLAQPSPTPSPTVTPTPSPTATATPSPTPSVTPTVVPSRSATPSPTVTPMTPPPITPHGPTPRMPTPTPTPMTPPPVSPPPTPIGPTATLTPEGYKTATPTPYNFKTPTPSPTPYGYKTPTPTPFQIDFYYRDLANSSFLYLWTPDTYYSIGWATDTWQEIFGMPDDMRYNAQWTFGTLTCWSGWFMHTSATQWLESCWPTPIHGPSPSPTPFQIDFYYRDPLRHSYLILHTPNTYYSIGYSSGAWQPLSGFPDNTWYNAQWSWGTRPDQTWWSNWFMHTTATQYLQAYWTTPTPSVTPTPTITVTPTASPSPSPTPSYAYWYLAAGATQIRPGPWVSQTINFEEYVQVTNPTTQTAPVEITYVDETGPLYREDIRIPPESRHTIKVNGKPGCAANDSISMMIYDSTDRIIMVERSMYWDAGGYTWCGGNNSVGNNTTNLFWYLPEGATHVFDTFIHVLNPDPFNSSQVRVTFMNEQAQTWTVEKSVGPRSNWTVYANDVVGSQAGISTTVDVLNGIPVAAERTMYWDTWEEEDPARYIEWVEGHASLGITETATKWYIPEGATHIFDHFILVQNPSLTESADVRVTFMDYRGKETIHDHTIPPHSRYTIWTNFILGSVPGFSAEVESRNGVNIFVEHATYWDAAGYHWAGGHGTIGLIHPAPLWFLPEGSTTIFDEYLMIANPNQTDTARVKITFMGDFGVQTEVRRSIPPHTRYTLRVNDVISSSAISSKVAETEDRVPIVVERAMYWDSPPTGGIHWKAGHSTIGIGVRNQLPMSLLRE